MPREASSTVTRSITGGGSLVGLVPGGDVTATPSPLNRLSALGAITTARAGRGGGRRRARDLDAHGRQREPTAPERIQALAVRLARLRVAHVGVERMAVVGHLRRSVGSGCGADQRGVEAGPQGRSTGRAQRRPRAGARTGAVAGRAGVGLEEVQRPTRRVDDDLAQATLGDVDRCALSTGGRGGSRRRGRAVGVAIGAVAATTAGPAAREHERNGRDACDEYEVSGAGHHHSSGTLRGERAGDSSAPFRLGPSRRFRTRVTPQWTPLTLAGDPGQTHRAAVIAWV